MTTKNKPSTLAQTVTISRVDLLTLQAKAEVCDWYIRVLGRCDPSAPRKLHRALRVLMQMRIYH